MELLRACVLYKLPQPLKDFAQAQLYPLLIGAPPFAAVQLFSICADATAPEAEGLRPIREVSAYIIMGNAHNLFEGADPGETARTLEKVVQAIENAVFNPREEMKAIGAHAQGT